MKAKNFLKQTNVTSGFAEIAQGLYSNLISSSTITPKSLKYQNPTTKKPPIIKDGEEGYLSSILDNYGLRFD